MRIDGIRGLQTVALQQQDTIAPAAPPKVDPFAKDTIEICEKEAIQPEPSLLSKVANWCWSLIWGESSDEEASPKGISVDNITSRPKLETPDEAEARKLQESLSDMHHLIHRVQETSESGQEIIDEKFRKNDTYYLNRLIESLNVLREIREDEELISKSFMEQSQTELRSIQQRFLDLNELIESNKKLSRYLKWTNIGLGGALTLGCIATFFTPAAMISLLTAFGAGVSLASGGATAVKGICDYKNQKREGEALVLQQKKERNHQSQQKAIEEIGNSMDEVVQVLNQMKHVLRNYHRTARMR